MQETKAENFLQLHQQEGCFLMPNAWDAGSAKMLAAAGFEAIATTSAGIAFAMGRPDNVFCAPQLRLTRDEMINAIRPIVDSVSLPVNADLEAGFGDSPQAVATTIQLAIEAGAVGANIEDYTGDVTKPLYDIELAIERIQAAREAIKRSGIPLVLVARTDRLNIGEADGFAESVERLNRYFEAGADCLFAPGAGNLDLITQLVREVSGPMNVVMGLASADISFSDLKSAGVRRVSIGGSLARALYAQIKSAAEEVLKRGTFTFAENQLAQGELNAIFEKNY